MANLFSSDFFYADRTQITVRCIIPLPIAHLIDIATAPYPSGSGQQSARSHCRRTTALVSGKYLIPKICLVDYLISPDAMCVRQKSFRHEILLKEFVDNMEGNSSK